MKVSKIKKNLINLTIILFFVFIFASAAFSRTVSIINSFSAASGAWGLAWDGNYLWIASMYSSGIDKMTTNGGLVNHYSFHDGRGLAWDSSGPFLWFARAGGNIEKLNPLNNLSVLTSFPPPDGSAQGLTWDGSFLWVINGQRIYNINTSGNIVSSFSRNAPSSPSNNSYGIAYKGGYLYVFDSIVDKKIRKMSTSGNILDEAFWPNEIPIDAVMDMESDGQYFWVIIANAGAYKVCQFDFEGGSPTPTVQFSQSTYSVNENAGSATITVNLSAASTQQVMVNYATSNGTATAGSDYTATSGTLTFSPGQTSKTFSVSIINDSTPEPTETVNLTLSSPVNAALESPSTAVLNILDDDLPTVYFSQSSYSVNENAGSATITVNLSAASTQQVMVNYATSNGTATAGSDYTATSDKLTFAPGQTSQSFTVPIIDNNIVEPNETVILTLNNPVNAVLGTPNQATLTIIDDDNYDPRTQIDYPGDPNNVFWFVHISDLHIGKSTDQSDNLEHFISNMSIIKPVIITASGDLTDSSNCLNVPPIGPCLPNGDNNDKTMEWLEYRRIIDWPDPWFDAFKQIYKDISGNHDRYRDADWNLYNRYSNLGSLNPPGQFAESIDINYGKHLFLGINTCDEQPVPFSLSSGISDIPVFSEVESTYASNKMVDFKKLPDSKLAFVFGHHYIRTYDTEIFGGLDWRDGLPGLYDRRFTPSDRGATRLKNMLNDNKASVYFFGHTHRNDVFWEDGQDFKHSSLVINTGSLGENGEYRLVAVDNGGISTRISNIDHFPVVLITSPVDRDLGDGGKNPYVKTVSNSSKNIIRALIFNNSNSPLRVDAYVNDWLISKPPIVANNLYQWEWDASSLNPGSTPTIKVEATVLGGMGLSEGNATSSPPSSHSISVNVVSTENIQYTLNLTKAGTGSGMITSVPAGISCGSYCNGSYFDGTILTLTATPSEGSTFAGWLGACSGTGTCIVTMDGDKAVTATFAASAPSQYTLTVLKSGTGGGTVTSNPSGINCGSDCSETYNQGISVILTATPDAGSTFGGWSGDADCSDGVVTMNANMTCTATFNPELAGKTLTVSKTGTGTGIVTSSPAGINCGSDCSETYSKVQKVKLTAKADVNSTFTGWSGGGCSGTKTCTVTVDTAVTVTADFALKTPDISVAQTSLDFGSVKVGKKVTKTLKIGNNGSGDLVITLSGLEGTDFSIQGSGSVTIKAKKTYSLKILFTPKSVGFETATLRITSNDPDTPVLDRSLSGTGL